MTLSAGDRLGPYEVLSTLGAGGMGEVYRAHDATLKRDVALKILPDGFALDPERLARFKREAQVLASLNHSNIAAIYGFEASNSTGSAHVVQALVLELVEGPTLADRIALGPISLEEALPIARQIAEALEAAHELGIVHRDLKPANVKLRPDGTVKVLDFGLAKTLEPEGTIRGDATASPTITSPAMTAMGMILGTAAYMSPEQAKGRQADKRSDVWAFGAVLYEMLSGRRAFTGDDVSDTLASVLRQDVDWTALPASTPAPVRRLIARCLDRDVKRRLRDIGEARIVLDEPATLTSVSVRDADTQHLPRPLWRRAMPALLSAIVVGGLAGTAAWYLKPSTPLQVTRFLFALPDGQPFTGFARRVIDISPDGTHIVYAANARLYLRSMSELSPRAIPGTELYQAVTNPVFSPDGRSIAFYAVSDQTVRRIAVTGGTAARLCTGAMPFGMSWGPNGILFSQGSQGISLVSAEGGTPPEVLVTLKDGEVAASPQLLPGGRDVLFAVSTGTALNRWDTADIVVQSIATAERKIIIKGGGDPRYVPTGHLVYAISNSLYAVAFDDQTMKAMGSPAPVVAGVRRAQVESDGANFGISGNGTLAYIPGASSPSAGMWEIALTDRRRGIESLKLPPGQYAAPRVSPDGTRIAFMTDDGNESIIHTYALSGASGMKRLTFGGKNRYPIWISNDRVAFQSDRDGDLAIFWQSIDGGAATRLTTPEQGSSHVPNDWSARADSVVFDVQRGSDVSLFTYAMRDGKAMPFGEVHSSNPTNAVFSPDGRWVAYTNTEGNRPRNYLQTFPPSTVQHELPVGPSGIALQPLWSPDQKELFYNPAPGQFAWVSVQTQSTFALGNPEMVPRPFQTGPPATRRQYDITRDGRFIGLIEAGQPAAARPDPPQFHVVLNWFEELKRLVPAAK
jgi:serine/threonine-protein kinase